MEKQEKLDKINILRRNCHRNFNDFAAKWR